MSVFPKLVTFQRKEDPEEVLPELAEYAYDFENNQFSLKDGKQYLVYGNEALKIWIFKALVTERYKYKAYSEDFGNEIYEVIGTTLGAETKKSEIKRYITECLMVNPYIRSILDIRLRTERERLYVEVDVQSIYEGEVVNVKCNMPMS